MEPGSDLQEPLEPFRFTTAGLGAADSLEAWREHLRPLLDIEPHADGSSGGTHAMTTWTVGDLVLCQDVSPGVIFDRAAKRVRAAPFDHYYLYVLKTGSYRAVSDGWRTEGRVSEGVVGRVALFSLAQPSHGVLKDMEGFTVFLPRDRLAGLTPALDAACNAPIDGPMGCLLADTLRHLEGRLPELTRGEAAGVSRALLELVGACFARSREDVDAAADALAVARKTRVRQLIHALAARPDLSIDHIAQAAGLSRSSLYRLFEAEGGIARYVERIRVRKALAALQDPADPRTIAEVAAHCGFSGSGDLSRAIKRQLGCSARDVRQSALDRSRQAAAPDTESAIRIALEGSLV